MVKKVIMKLSSECNLAQLVVDLLNGQTLVFPTETSYGLGCDATNQESVDKIFKIKGRSDDKPLLIVVPSVAEAKKYLAWNETLEQLASNYWPGALTVVGEYKGGGLAKGVVAKDNTVAVRVSKHPLIKSITEKMGRPLVATSANLAGLPSLYNAEEISKIFAAQDIKPDIILNYGILPVRPATTLVSVVGGKLNVLRQGELKV